MKNEALVMTEVLKERGLKMALEEGSVLWYLAEKKKYPLVGVVGMGVCPIRKFGPSPKQ